MIRAAWDRVTKWWAETGRPMVDDYAQRAGALAKAWWADLEENPKLHFISMVFGMAVLYAVKFAAWLVA